MTLSTDINLPRPNIDIEKNSNINSYLSELNDRLSEMYQDIAQNVNGYIRDWTPIVYGNTTTGVGTYTTQWGWLRRSGIIVELWMDVAWTAHTGSGRVAILMPYTAANSNGSPFVGVIESSGVNNFAPYTYLTWRVEPNTTESFIIRNQSGVVSSRLGLAASGGFRGYIQYIGKEFED